MIAVSAITDLRTHLGGPRRAGATIGVVPTMGALHAGHVALIEQARGECGHVVVTVFVNPAQFGPAEDFDQYPRPLDEDLATCREAGVDVVFCPPESEIYPEHYTPWLCAGRLGEVLCGRFRPGHFDGVCQVVAKLFNIVEPQRAYFGHKDAQQLAIIRHMAAALNFPLEVVGCPTCREADGLALSSRNRYLSPSERQQAAVLYATLQWLEQAVLAGRRDRDELLAEARERITAAGPCEIQYVDLVDASTLETWDAARLPVLAALAVVIGSCRLIDNILIDDCPPSG